MGKLIKYSLFGMAGLGLLVIAAGILIINLDPNHYKDYIAQKLSREINRPFKIGQGIKIQYYPWLGLEASGIIIGNAKGFGESPFFEADTLKIRLKTLPLIKKQIEMDTIILTGARIRLAKNRAGLSNWQDLGNGTHQERQPKASPDSKKSPAKAPSSGISSRERQASQNENGFDSSPLKNMVPFLAGGLDIRDVSISFHDRASDAKYQVSRLDITMDKFMPGDPIGLRASFDGLAENPAVSGRVSLMGTIYYDINTGKYQIKPLSVQAELQGDKVGKTPARLTMTSAIEMGLEQGMLAVRDLRITGLGTTMAGLGISLAGDISALHLGSDKAVLEGNVILEGKEMAPLLKAFGQNDFADLLHSISIKAGIKGDLQELWISPLGARATLSGKQIPNSPVHLTLDTAARVSVNEQTLELDSFSLKGLGLDARGKLHAQQIISSPLYTGRLSLAQFDPGALMKKLNQPLPATADDRVFKKMAFKAKFSGSARDVRVSELTMTMDQTRVMGVVGITNFQDPDIGFDLKIDRVNVDRYLPVARGNGKKSKRQEPSKLSGGAGALAAKNRSVKPITPETITTAVATRIPMEKLQRLKAKGKLIIGDLIVSKAHLQEVKINLDARNGNIAFAPLSANLYGGTYTGELFLDARGKLPRLTLAAVLKGVEAEPLLKDVTGKARIRGTGDVTLALTTKGEYADAFKKNMNGKIGFRFKNGAVKGFNASQFLRSLKSLRKSQPFQMAAEEETDFTDLTGNPAVKNGVVFLNDLEGKSPALRLSGTGTLADLVQETMEYTVNVTVVETSKGQAGKELAELSGITIPIHIKGPLKDPSISPDISGVIASFATRELTQKLSEKLGIKSADPKPAADAKSQDLNQTQEQAPSDSVEILKQTLEKELGNIFKGLFD